MRDSCAKIPGPGLQDETLDAVSPAAFQEIEDLTEVNLFETFPRLIDN